MSAGMLMAKCCCTRRLQNCSTGALRPYYATPADVPAFGPFFRYNCEPLKLGPPISSLAGLTRVLPASVVPYASCTEVLATTSGVYTGSVTLTLSGVDAGMCACVGGTTSGMRKHEEIHFDGTYSLAYDGASCQSNRVIVGYTATINVGVAYRGRYLKLCTDVGTPIVLSSIRLAVVYVHSSRKILDIQVSPVNSVPPTDPTYVGRVFSLFGSSNAGNWDANTTIPNGIVSCISGNGTIPNVASGGTALVTGPI